MMSQPADFATPDKRLPYFDPPPPWRCHWWWDPIPDWPKLDRADLAKFVKLELMFRTRELGLQLEKIQTIKKEKIDWRFDPVPPMLESLLSKEKLIQFGKLRLDQIEKQIEIDTHYLEETGKLL